MGRRLGAWVGPAINDRPEKHGARHEQVERTTSKPPCHYILGSPRPRGASRGRPVAPASSRPSLALVYNLATFSTQPVRGRREPDGDIVAPIV